MTLSRSDIHKEKCQKERYKSLKDQSWGGQEARSVPSRTGQGSLSQAGPLASAVSMKLGWMSVR